jgi:N-acetylmuramoyl-L-alanine amidase
LGVGEQKLFLNLELYSRNVLKYVVLLLLFLSPSFSAASDKVKVKDIHHWSSPDYTRIVIDMTGPAEFSKNRLSNPDRLYFDLKNTSIVTEIKTTLPVGDGILKTVRASQFNPDTVRVVLDIEEITDYNSFVLEDPARLVIDLYGKGKQIDRPATNISKRRIVIDAGHGGHDPGAIGPNKLYEKDVVLDIALKVKKILKADPMYEVFLTREKDIFIPLEERTAIANRKDADLFVSIHANASPGIKARGVETYLLNWTDDEEAMKVAARENRISLKKMKAMNRQMDIVEVIKSDLMRENKRDESLKLANYVQRSMISTLENNHNVHDLGVKQALFYVLFGAKMPSVLAEVSFISNPDEEKLLSRDSYRMEIARAIADGVTTYFTSSPAVQKVVRLNSSR